MRVLHVTSTFPRSDGDPTGPFLADLVAAERAAGLHVRVLAPHDAGLEAEGVVAGVGVRRFRYGPAAAETLAYRGGLLSAGRTASGAAMVAPYLAAMVAATVAETRRWRPDVIHAHWWLPAGLAAAAASRLTGCPYVVTLHGSDVALVAGGAGHRPLGAAARRVLRGAAAVLAVSDALAAEAEQVIGLAPVQIAVMPVVAPRIGPGRTSEAGHAGDVRLLAVGRLVPEKGFDVLLDALAAAGPVPHLSLDLVGDGPLAGALQRRAAGHDVRFLGALPRPALHTCLAAADAVVVPSRREGLGLVAVEAVLFGTPVIASHTGGLPEVLGAAATPVPAGGHAQVVAGGVLVAPGDVAGLAAAIALVPLLRPPGPAALAAVARHAPEAVAARHAEVYATAAAVVARRRGRHGVPKAPPAGWDARLR